MDQFAAAKSHRSNNFVFQSCVKDIAYVVSFLEDINWKVISCHI